MKPKPYHRAMAAYETAVRQALLRMAPLVNEWENDSSIAQDANSRSAFESELAGIERECARVKELRPPDNLRRAHEFAVQSADLFATFAHNQREVLDAPTQYNNDHFTIPLKQANEALKMFKRLS